MIEMNVEQLRSTGPIWPLHHQSNPLVGQNERRTKSLLRRATRSAPASHARRFAALSASARSRESFAATSSGTIEARRSSGSVQSPVLPLTSRALWEFECLCGSYRRYDCLIFLLGRPQFFRDLALQLIELAQFRLLRGKHVGLDHAIDLLIADQIFFRTDR
jgi:hypothetical protein